MPRATLAFRLPAEREEFEHAVHADAWWLLAWDVAEELRAIEKYGRDGFDSETAAKLREWLYREMEERGLRTDG
jgi:hypothetical protein